MKEKKVYIGLGSNIEPRHMYINKAIDFLNDGVWVKVIRTSSLYETKAETSEPQDDYINAVAELATILDPEGLINRTKEVELQCGRVRKGYQSPRTLDIDILLYENQKIITPQVVIPHPRMIARGFVIIPLAEIAPHVIHPEEGKSMIQLALGNDFGGIKLLPGGEFWTACEKKH